jgi:hypothetical protein
VSCSCCDFIIDLVGCGHRTIPDRHFFSSVQKGSCFIWCVPHAFGAMLRPSSARRCCTCAKPRSPAAMRLCRGVSLWCTNYAFCFERRLRNLMIVASINLA